MKILIQNTDYTFNALAKTVTLTAYGSIAKENVLLITNVTDGIIIYNFADSSKGGTVATNVLTLTYDTTAMSNTDELQIWYWDTTATVVTGGLTDAELRATPVPTVIKDSNGEQIDFISDVIPTIQLTGQFRGKNAAVYNITGRRGGFTSISVLNDVKEFDNAVALMPVLSAATLDIISSSASDTNTAGTGVRKVKVTYIDSSNNLVQSADINLNGTTLVTSVLTGVNEVLWMAASDVGSVGKAVGNIRLRINGGTVEVEQISTENTRSLSGRFMVPTGYTGYLNAWNIQAINNDQDVRLTATLNRFNSSLTSIFQSQALYVVALNTNSGGVPLPLIKLPPLCKVRIGTFSGATGAAVKCAVTFQVIIIED